MTKVSITAAHESKHFKVFKRAVSWLWQIRFPRAGKPLFIQEEKLGWKYYVCPM